MSRKLRSSKPTRATKKTKRCIVRKTSVRKAKKTHKKTHSIIRKKEFLKERKQRM
uniref:Uncharacterized protein n=1 Tax=viral metagenome TaxID=1070528 RepID=A0A6C0EG88_9ZZZZ